MPASYWSGTALKTALINVTDCQSVIDAMVLQMTSTLPAAERWTSLGGGEYKSPVDAAGFSMRLVLTRLSATRIGLLVKDHNGATPIAGSSNGALNIDSGVNVWVFSGPRHWAIATSSDSGNRRCAYASILDPSPEPLDAHTRRIAFHVPRSEAGTINDGVGDSVENIICQDYGGWGYLLRIVGPFIGGTSAEFRFPDGAYCSIGALVASHVSAANCAAAGYMNQFAIIDRGNADYTEVDVPVDTGVAGKFFVLPKLSRTYGPISLAVRVPG